MESMRERLVVRSTGGADGVVRVTVDGDLDALSSSRFRAGLAAALPDRGLRRVELDLAGVGFLDAAGVGELATARQAAARGGCQLVIVAASPVVELVLGVLGQPGAPHVDDVSGAATGLRPDSDAGTALPR